MTQENYDLIKLTVETAKQTMNVERVKASYEFLQSLMEYYCNTKDDGFYFDVLRNALVEVYNHELKIYARYPDRFKG